MSCSITRKSLIDFGVDAAKIQLIPLGIDLERFLPPVNKKALKRSLSIPANAFCIGSFQKDGIGWQEGNEPKLIKGPDIFLRTIKNLSRQFDNLMVILTGPARGYVKKGLEEIGVPYIHNHLTKYHDIVKYYQSCDLYMISSRAEGGPKGLLESWATGVPVVSTKVGMCADFIRHRQNGMLADVDDVDALTEFSAELIQNRELYQRCQTEALKEASRFTWANIAGMYYDTLYQTIIDA